MVDLRSVGVNGLVSEFDLRLELPAHRPLPSRSVHAFWLVGVDKPAPSLELQDVQWMVRTSDGETSGPFRIQDRTAWGMMPELLRTTRVRTKDVFRHTALHAAEVNLLATVARPDRPGSATDHAYITRARLRVSVGEGGAQGFDVARQDPYTAMMVRRLALNWEQLPQSIINPSKEVPADLRAWSELLAAAAERGPILMAELPRGGIYRIRGEDLRQAGLKPEDIPFSQLRFYHRGKEIAPITIEMRTDRLVGNASAVFHVPEDPADRKPFHALWILRGPATETAPRSKANYFGAPMGTRVFPISHTVRVFEPNVYNHGLPIDSPQLRWATAEVPPGAYREFKFDAGGLQPGASVKMRVWLINQSNTGNTNYRILINSQQVSQGGIRGTRMESIEVPIPTEMFRDGENSLAVENVETTVEGDASAMFFLQAEFDLPGTTRGAPTQREWVLESVVSEGATFTLPRSRAMESNGYLVQVLPDGEARFLQIGRTGGDVDPGFTAVLPQDEVFDRPRFVFSSEQTLHPMPPIKMVPAPRSLLETKAVQYLIVAHSSLREPLARLVEEREKTQAVDVLDVEDFYAAFNYGEVSYKAIHAGLQHTFKHREGPALSSVLLVGEGSEYWWEKRRASAEVSPNLLPVYGWQDPKVRIRGDDNYGRLLGEGPLTDVEVGRISVNTAEELDKFLTKTLKYETDPPPGPWRNRNLFVTDDEPEFLDVVTQVIDKTMGGANVPIILALQQFPYEDYFRGFWRKRSPKMTDTLLDEWDRGARTILYMGHGGPNIWAGERILHIRDVVNLNDGGRHPILVAGSCDTGWVDYPLDPVKASLSEELTRNPNGGAVAAFIPIDGTTSYEHNFLLTAFYEGLMRRNLPGLGAVALFSKIEYHLRQDNASVTEQYLLMGDPALKPVEIPSSMELTTTPEALLSVTGGKLTVRGKVEGMDWGMADVYLFSPSYKEIKTQRVRVKGGAFEVELDIPAVLNEEGNCQLVAVAFNEAMGQHASASKGVPLVREEINLEWQVSPPMDVIHPPGTPLQLTLTVRNGSPLPLPNGVLLINEKASGEEVARFGIALGPKGSFTRVFPLPMPAGMNRIEARAYLSAEAKATDPNPLAVAEVLLMGRDPKAPFLGFSPGTVEVRRRAGGGALFNVKVWNVSTRLQTQLGVVLRRNDSANGTEMGVMRTIGSLEPGDNTLLSYDTPAFFRPGKENFTLEVYDTSQGDRRLLQATFFDLLIKDGPDLEVVPEEFIAENERPRRGNTVYFRALIRNRGDAPAYNVKTQLYLDEPWDQRREAPNQVPWASVGLIPVLYPGDEQEVRMRWDPAVGTADGKIFMTATTVPEQEEVDRANNVASLSVTLLPAPNIKVASFTASQPLARPFDSIRVNAEVVNDSPEDFARTFRVSAYALGPNGVRRRVFTERFNPINAKESVSISFAWVVRDSEFRLELNANEDREYLEGTFDDNNAAINFPYLFPEKSFRTEEGLLDFAGFPSFAALRGLTLRPDGSLTTVRRPAALQKAFGWQREFLVEGEAEPGSAVDNLYGLRQGVVAAFGEMPKPLRFRFPLDPNDDTTLYDVSIFHTGAKKTDQLNGVFRHRVEAATAWTLEESRRNLVPLGIVETKDDALDIAIAPPDYPTSLHLLSITASALAGEYESPIVELQEVPRGRLRARTETPGESRVVFAVRYGAEATEGITWQPWQAARVGETLPSPTGPAQFLQWRARLVMGVDVAPVLRSVAIERTPPPGGTKSTAGGY